MNEIPPSDENDTASHIQIPDGLTPVRLGSGVVSSILGEGGVAVVYEIYVEKLGIKRAVKLLRPNVSSDTVKRFSTEMSITAQLRHPHIVAIHAVGEWNGIPYIEMEKIDGFSLDKLIELRGALPLDVCTSIGIMVCRALQFTHTHNYILDDITYEGILHRDLKPANILVPRDGVVKLTDFGIATPVNISLHTTEGTVVGSLQYLSPEQMEGKPATTASDIFSLGCILYEMITGTKIFGETNMTRLVADRMKNRFAPLRQFNAKIPNDLCKIVEQCLAINSGKRPFDVAAILVRLEKIHDRLTMYPPEEVVEYFVNLNDGKVTLRRSRKKLALAIITAAGISLLVAGGLFVYRNTDFLTNGSSVMYAPVPEKTGYANVADSLALIFHDSVVPSSGRLPRRD